ncbi:MAG: hypothetical protein ACTHL8_23985 [Burkholderiaceae bacterium]
MADATPFFGISPFVLGMSRETVHAAAGRPDSVETSQDEDGSVVESWFYQGGEIELEFDQAADARLESITAWSSTTTVNGVAIIGQPVEELARLAREADIHDLELTDDFADAGQCFQSEQHGLMFWVAKGRIANVTIFPRFDDEGETPQWPE